MSIPKPTEFQEPGPRRDSALAELEADANQLLLSNFEANRSKGDDHLAKVLIETVERYVVEALGRAGYEFGRLNYDGDVDYWNSGQTWGSGKEFGTGIILDFKAFKCSAEWRTMEDLQQ